MRKHLLLTMLLMAGMPFAGQFNVMAAPEPQQQSQTVTTITGTVLDENNEPIIGASVVQRGATRNAAATDAFGHFTMRVPAGAVLQVSYVGYKTATVNAANDMVVYMQPSTEMLNELVAVGYGSQKRANLTGAVATVDVARTMDSRPTTDVAKALQGAVPGLTITSGDGSALTSATMKIRGTGTLSNDQTSNPLIVVDGVPVDDLSMLNPEDIAEISVLKDAASSAVYGTRAAFGVILITTKTPSTADRVSVKYTNNFGWSQATVLPEFDTVPNQLRAVMAACQRTGTDQEIFGQYYDLLLPLADLWQAQHGKAYNSNVVMQPYESDSNVGDYAWDAKNGKWLYYANWNVGDIMFNNAAPSSKHNVSLEGTSGKTQYRLSFGYDSRQDLMNYSPDKVKRYTANANISTEIFSWLRAGVRFNFAQNDITTHYVQSGARYVNIWRWGSYFTVLGQRPDENGDLYQFTTIAGRQDAGADNRVINDTKIQAWMEATILPGLTLHADYTYDVISNNRERFYLPIKAWNTWNNSATTPIWLNSAAPSNSDTYQYNTRATSWATNVYATYAHTFDKAHNLKVMVGGTADQYQSNYFWAGRDILLDYEKPYLALSTGGADGNAKYLGQSMSRRATAGFFGRINYDYKGIYLLEVNGRYDGSSRFPAADQWAFFPSASAGYRFTEENYFKPVKETGILTNGKIRASYGHIGNEAVGENRFLSVITTNSSRWLNSSGSLTNMFSRPTLVSSSLTWERVITTDVGIDLGLLNNSLNLTFDWFQRDTKDMLAPGNEMPAALGSGAPYVNEGHLRTRGWELGVNWNHSFGDADVYASFNIYDGTTKVVNYNTEVNALNGFYSGQKYGDIWGFETERFFNESDFVLDANGKVLDYAEGVASQTALERGAFHYGPGDVKFKDLDGSGEIDGGKGTAEDHGDLKVIGNALPRYEYSFRLGGAWKGFDLDLFFQGVGKRDMWSVSGFVIPFANNCDVIYSNQMSFNSTSVDENGVTHYNIDQNNTYPVPFGGNAGVGSVPNVGNGTNNFYPQSKYLMNMAYLRFKNLTVGYTLPAAITRKALIQKARVYFSADNLCLLYNGMKNYPLDPEIGSTWGQGLGQTNVEGGAVGNTQGNGYFGRTTPMNRTFSFGIQVTF